MNLQLLNISSPTRFAACALGLLALITAHTQYLAPCSLSPPSLRPYLPLCSKSLYYRVSSLRREWIKIEVRRMQYSVSHDNSALETMLLSLPDEILLTIARKLPGSSLQQLCHTSSDLYHLLCEEEDLWRRACKTEYNVLPRQCAPARPFYVGILNRYPELFKHRYRYRKKKGGFD